MKEKLNFARAERCFRVDNRLVGEGDYAAERLADAALKSLPVWRVGERS